MIRLAIGPRPAYVRVAGFVVLAAIELAIAKALFSLPNIRVLGPSVVAAYFVAKTALLAIPLFFLVAWPRRDELLAEIKVSDNGPLASYALVANIASFTLLLLVRNELSQSGESAAALWPLAYSLLVLVTVLSLLVFIVPKRFLVTIATSWRWEAGVALTVAVIGVTVSEFLNLTSIHFVPESTWDGLSSATLQLSYWLLALFQDNAFMDPGTRILGAGNFSVEIFAACSGYEGMTLIAIFLIGYLWVFRRSLRFPQVLILFPLAMGIIWLFNAVRIALLVAIGANISPKVALGGFHSQFGWISFLIVAIAVMMVAQQVPFFSTSPPSRSRGTVLASKSTDDEVVFFLAPFIAMMAAQIAIRAFSPYEQALYPLKDLAIAAAIYLYRRAYVRFTDVPSALAIALGAAAGILWIATDPGAGSETALSRWIAELTPLAFVVWLCFRGIGTIVMVPVAEELAFRGYLYRVLIARPFEDVDLKAFSMRALIISSALFGLMHDRWLAGALAGALYALLMCRNGRLSDAIAAHMATNGIIFGWAITTGQWSLL